MNSLGCPFARGASLAWTAAACNATASSDVAVRLQQADVWLFWVGLAVAAGLLLWALFKHVGNPLANAVPRPNTLPLEAIFVPISVFIIVSLSGTPLVHRFAEGYSQRGANLAAGSVGMAAGAAACLYLSARFFTGGAAMFLFGGGRIARQVGESGLFLLLSLPLCGIVHEATRWVFHVLLPDYALPEHDVIEALRDPAEPSWTAVTLWLGAVIVAPVAEECFFRGILQTVVNNAFGRPWMAVLTSAVVFGLAHGSQWPAVPALMLLGVILGCLYERSGAMIGPILMHALFNLRTLTWEAVGAGA